MKSMLPVVFAAIAAVGNAMFALGQKLSGNAENGLLFVGASALVAVLLALFCAPFTAAFDAGNMLKSNWKAILLSGFGLFFTYLGFNLLYTRYGASHYVLYAVLSIITTTILVGVFWLKEPINMYHKIAIAMAVTAVIFFSVGQSKL
jgi:drug/metabolite transporter (DMT)-like permease